MEIFGSSLHTCATHASFIIPQSLGVLSGWSESQLPSFDPLDFTDHINGNLVAYNFLDRLYETFNRPRIPLTKAEPSSSYPNQSILKGFAYFPTRNHHYF